MRTLLQILRFSPGGDPKYKTAHHLWLALALTAMGICVGLLALAFGATAYLKLPGDLMMESYLDHDLILFLNLLPPVLLIWLFYFLTRRCWAAFLGSFLPVVGAAMVNYFKIRLRSDPLLGADLRLAAEAGQILSGYTLDVTWLVAIAPICLIVGLLFTVLLMPNGLRGWKNRTFGALSTLALIAVAFVTLFTNPGVYQQVVNNDYIDRWSDVEVYVSKGCTYSFLYSFRDMLPAVPEGYDKKEAAALLAQYPDGDIPEEQQVSVLAIMLEAFCDLTDFAPLAVQEGVAQVYAPWHELEERSVSGDLLTNIFAGGTVDSEWGFLTGYSTHADFRSPTDSYVWYLRNQGYQTFGSHTGYGWFYNRQNVNQYLGFEEYWFTENHYGPLVDPEVSKVESDHLLMGELLDQLKDRAAEGPCFSFSVTYQNHGPYESTYTLHEEYLTPAAAGLQDETCNVWNNYLHGVADTIHAVTELTAGLEEMAEPVVLVLFGDHKPWGGNGNAAYTDVGATFDFSTPNGFSDYYSAPYLIWANSAAKAALGRDFTGDGGDFSPCFLMPEVFDQCGWEGPGFMALARQARDASPLLHSQGLYLADGQLTNQLSGAAEQAVSQFLRAQYYREQEIDPAP